MIMNLPARPDSMMACRVVAVLVPLMLLYLPATAAPVEEKIVMGWLETVFLNPWGLRVTAKLDTGAKTSSVHASQIEHFSRDGGQWVRFAFSVEGKPPMKIERPVVRTAVIKERLERSSVRDVVNLSICKNGREYETEFTLNDRSNFNYPLLLGRSFLEKVALVDAAATFVFPADKDACGAQAGAGERPGDRQSR